MPDCDRRPRGRVPPSWRTARPSTARARTPTPPSAKEGSTSSSRWTAACRDGVHALRLTSDLVHEHDGRRDKIPAAPGGRYVGLVLLFDLESLVPLAIVHDGELQRVRVGATSALAADRLARADARVAAVDRRGLAGRARKLRACARCASSRRSASSRRRARSSRRSAPSTARHGGRSPRGDRRRGHRRPRDQLARAGARRRPGSRRDSTSARSAGRRARRGDSVAPASHVVRSHERATYHFAPEARPRSTRSGATACRRWETVELGEVVAGRAGRASDGQITLFSGGGTGGLVGPRHPVRRCRERRLRGGAAARPRPRAADRVVHPGGEAVKRYGSDVMVDAIKACGFRYVSLNPGRSYRGLHDSLVNYGGNDPEIVTCNHEKLAVGIAHGYAKAAREPMACILHDIVGLLHGAMGVYYAWIDRAPVVVFGGAGPWRTTGGGRISTGSTPRTPGQRRPRLHEVGRPAGVGHVGSRNRSCAATASLRRRPRDRSTSGSTPGCRRRSWREDVPLPGLGPPADAVAASGPTQRQCARWPSAFARPSGR